ncbi:MAG: hypothetical protein M3275_12305 [Thermoproteota archaeon]|nr:hypothetical protein [Thermoproteota archaeon]
MILEHYKYPETYIRNSKKAFISIVDDTIIRIGLAAVSIVANTGKPTINFLMRILLSLIADLRSM